MFMKASRFSFLLITLSFLLVAGCATVGGDDTENNNQNNENTNENTNTNNNTNNNTNGTGLCSDTCTGENQVCVGPDEEHQTCVDKCEENACSSPYTCCYGGCVNLQADPNNCGSCWNSCGDDASCINGICVDACNNMCRAEEDCCGGICTDVTGDPSNCGACNNVCNTSGAEPTASSCTNGYCTCGTGPECTGGKVCCGASCKNLDTDPTNCGGCGSQCAEGEACVNGTCECSPGVSCNLNQACCGGVCVDTLSDDNNCGSCGNTCDGGYSCNNGECNCGGEVCQGGSLPGQDAECCPDGKCVQYDFGLGAENCGSCGNDCGALDLCMMGTCTQQ
jgi:hypothetical protein